MRDQALAELTRAEALLANWKYLPGSQVKILVSHLVKALDLVASYVMGQPTVIERSYLSLSSVKLFNDSKIEQSFYDNYYYLMSLLRKDISRVNAEAIRIVGVKQSQVESKEYFEELIESVRSVVNEAFD